MTAQPHRRMPFRPGHPLHLHRLRHTAGVTMIELLIAITIVGILAGVGIPQLAGVYSNQLVANAANEMVSDIELAQNRALSNDQQEFANMTPKNDCKADPSGKRYIDAWGIKVTSTSQYQLIVNYRVTSKETGLTCLGSTDGDVMKVTTNLPSNVEFSSGNGASVKYATTSGKAAPSAGLLDGSNSVIIRSTRTDLKYYICVSAARRVYAKTTPCP